MPGRPALATSPDSSKDDLVTTRLLGCGLLLILQ